MTLDAVERGRGVVFQSGTHGNPGAGMEYTVLGCPAYANTSRYLAWDLQPGDALLWFGDTVHFAWGGDRRVVSVSLISGEAVFSAARPPHLSWHWYGHGLQDGDTIAGPYFPQIYPAMLESEVSHNNIRHTVGKYVPKDLNESKMIFH